MRPPTRVHEVIPVTASASAIWTMQTCDQQLETSEPEAQPAMPPGRAAGSLLSLAYPAATRQPLQHNNRAARAPCSAVRLTLNQRQPGCVKYVAAGSEVGRERGQLRASHLERCRPGLRGAERVHRRAAHADKSTPRSWWTRGSEMVDMRSWRLARGWTHASDSLVRGSGWPMMSTP